MRDIRIPGWVLAALLAITPGLLVGVIAHRELGSLTMALIAGATTTGGVATLLSMLVRINR